VELSFTNKTWITDGYKKIKNLETSTLKFLKMIMAESAISKFTFLNSWAGYLIYSWGSRGSGPVLRAMSRGNYLVLTLLVLVGVLRTCASIELVVVLSGSCTWMRSSFCLVFLGPHCAPQYVLRYVLCAVCRWSYLLQFLVECLQDEFSFTGMASEAKQKVGGRVTGCALNQGEFVTRVILYVTILGSYDVVIGMDWLESHEAIRNCKTKRLSLVDDEGQRRVIVGRNQGVSLRFVSSLQLRKSMRKGCKLYAILALNEKGVAEGLEHLPVVKELRTYSQRSCLGCRQKENLSLL
jgi:hypothetical protein